MVKENIFTKYTHRFIGTNQSRSGLNRTKLLPKKQFGIKIVALPMNKYCMKKHASVDKRAISFISSGEASFMKRKELVLKLKQEKVEDEKTHYKRLRVYYDESTALLNRKTEKNVVGKRNDLMIFLKKL